MKTLRMAPKLALPLSAVTESIGILAKRRAGKSTTARRLTEQLAHARQQVVVIDPKGDWWGLRYSRDGKGAGLPFVVMGGEHFDVKLERGAGELVARLVVTDRVSVILDLSEFRRDDRDVFITAFMETLYRMKAQEKFRTPVMLIVDEADLIAPQKMRGPHSSDMVGAITDLVRRGGQRGIGVTMISQRSASIDKDVLTQLGILIVLQTIAPQDRKAIEAWIDAHGTPEQAKELMQSLSSLDKGNGWIWAPGFPAGDGLFERHQFMLPETFDSSATPTAGKRRIELQRAAKVDLDAFRRDMAATIKAAEDNDPKRLKSRVAELERELAIERAKDPAKPYSPLKAQHVRRLEVSVKSLERVAERATNIAARAEKAMTEIRVGLAKATPEQPGRMLPAPKNPPGTSVSKTINAMVGDVVARVTAPVKGTITVHAMSGGDAGVKLNPGEKLVLQAVGQHPNGVTPTLMSVLVPSIKHTSRKEYIRRLFHRQLVDKRDDGIHITPAGVQVLTSLGLFKRFPTDAAEVRRQLLASLPVGERAILQLAIEDYPNQTTAERLAAQTGFKPSSVKEYLRRLKRVRRSSTRTAAIALTSICFRRGTTMTTEAKKPMGISELVARIGDDNIRIEPIEANVQGAKLIDRGKLTELRIVTSMTNPSQILGLTDGRPLPNLGLVLWFPRHLSDRARLEHDDAAAAPSDAAQLAAMTRRAMVLDDLVQTLLIACIDVGRGAGGNYVRCRQCFASAPRVGAAIDHRRDCIVPQVRAALAAL